MAELRWRIPGRLPAGTAAAAGAGAAPGAGAGPAAGAAPGAGTAPGTAPDAGGPHDFPHDGTITIPNRFATSYRGEARDGERTPAEISGPEADELERYFGQLPADMFYAIYFRDFLMDGGDGGTAEQVALLEFYCEVAKWHMSECRQVIRRYDEHAALFEDEPQLPAPPAVLESLIRDLGRATRSNGGGANAEDLGPELRDKYLDELGESPELVGAFTSIAGHIGAGRVSEARREYRQLYRYLGPGFEARYEVLVTLENIAGTRYQTENRLLRALEGQGPFAEARERVALRFEGALAAFFRLDAKLSQQVIDEKVAALREATNVARGSASWKDIYNAYFRYTDDFGKNEKCFGILVREGRKDLAAFSGCCDGQWQIADFLGQSRGAYDAFQATLKRIVGAPAFASRFEHAPISRETRYCARDVGGCGSVSLGQAIDSSGEVVGRMFTCAERKLLAAADGDLGAPRLGVLIIKRGTCSICDDAIGWYRAKPDPFECVFAEDEFDVGRALGAGEACLGCAKAIPGYSVI